MPLSSRPVSDLIVTVDGPGGTGKSSVSREVAVRAGLPHLDTGAFYRAATLAVMRLASSFDRPDDPHEQLLARLLGPVIKYWTCKRAPQHAVESLECFGGVGYVEESDMPRLFRQSPVNGIWEGSGNVICLDVLRAMGREPASIEAFRSELELARGADRRYDEALDRFDRELGDLDAIEHRARRLVESMALLFEGSLVLQHSPAAVADAFCASRLTGDWGQAFGTLPAGTDFGRIIERHMPVA